jgi:acyl-lipid omega-6 desaturase (Delta-12 desaturase)
MSIADIPTLQDATQPHLPPADPHAAAEDRLRRRLAPYRRPNTWAALWQLINTLGPILLLWWAAWKSVDIHYGLTLLLCLPIAGFMVRSFVLHHDCSHGSFFATRWVNEFWGFWLGLITLTPFHRWRRSHNFHHAHSGDLDNRGGGYITLYTLSEYRALSFWQRLGYRLYRHPIVLFVVGPLLQFVILERFTWDLPKTASTARRGVWKSNLAIAAFAVGIYLLGGWDALGRFSMIYFPASLVAAGVGVWLFYVQHNYEEAYFKRHGDWNFNNAALDGSSFYDLPAVFHFFSGNIGYHHIHHFESMIPNYYLARCHRENREFHVAPRITLRESLNCLGLHLWDEDQQRLVPFSAARDASKTT